MPIKSRRGPKVTPDEQKLVGTFATQCLKEICKKPYDKQNQAKPAL